MLFKKLFIATLAALALVGCNDDNDIDNPVLTDAGDVNVVFATSSSEQAVTKSDGTASFETDQYKNFTPTDQVKEYVRKETVTDSEFVINHMTVFVFDETGGLVKTSSFKDAQADETKAEEASTENSICEFGGIVLKEGTYNFILVGNLEKDNITPASEGASDFIKYQNATINWTGAVSAQIAANTYLPMVKVLEGITLTAHKVTASATLNLIGGGEVAAPEGENDTESTLSVSSAIQLTRLVARIQLKSLAFNWTVNGEGGETPAASISLKKVYLANASNKSVLTGDNEGDGYVHGFTVTEDMFFQGGEADVNNLSKELEDAVTIENGKDGKVWVSSRPEAEREDTDLLPLSFYAFGKTINAEDNDQNLTMVLECSAAYNTSAETAPAKSVYYYVPIRNSDITGLVANKVYNVNVTLTGQGSDENGKKQDKVENLTLGLSVGNWNGPIDIPINGDPTPVPNN